MGYYDSCDCDTKFCIHRPGPLVLKPGKAANDLAVERIRREAETRYLATKAHILQMLETRHEVYSREVWEDSDKVQTIQQTQATLARMEKAGILDSRISYRKPGEQGLQRRYYHLKTPE